MGIQSPCLFDAATCRLIPLHIFEQNPGFEHGFEMAGGMSHTSHQGSGRKGSFQDKETLWSCYLRPRTIPDGTAARTRYLDTHA